MKVLHVNNTDLSGRRFSGFDLLDQLIPYGIESTQAVLDKQSDDSRVFSLWQSANDLALHAAAVDVESRHHLNNVLFPWGQVLADTPAFHQADVIHYHIVHNQVVSLADMARLSKLKPAVWTLHDPWALTGHCIYLDGCEGWRTGCDPCPYPGRPFPLSPQGSGEMWRLKREVYEHLDADIVVASRFMLDMVQSSPLGSLFKRVHLIPFGIHQEVYLPDSQRADARRELGIPENNFVVHFRSSTMAVKGTSFLIEALRSAPPSRPTTLLTVDTKGLLDEVQNQYHVVELGWVKDAQSTARALSACDVFVMPSTSESFGMMALEAMAAGRPVVCFSGTAVPSLVHAPDCGVAVESGDSVGLRVAIDELAANPDELHRRGQLARQIAARDHSHGAYLQSLAALYLKVGSGGSDELG